MALNKRIAKKVSAPGQPEAKPQGLNQGHYGLTQKEAYCMSLEGSSSYARGGGLAPVTRML